MEQPKSGLEPLRSNQAEKRIPPPDVWNRLPRIARIARLHFTQATFKIHRTQLFDLSVLIEFDERMIFQAPKLEITLFLRIDHAAGERIAFP